MNTLSEDQIKHYGFLWSVADADGDGEIGIADAAVFFPKSEISAQELETIWFEVNPQNGPLNTDQFIYYCELISMAQNNLVPNLQELMQIKLAGIRVPFPKFTGVTPESTSIDYNQVLLSFLSL